MSDNFYDKLKRIEWLAGNGYWTRRIHAETQYLANLSATADNAYNAEIEKALDYLLTNYDENQALTKADVLHAEEMLAPLSEKAKQYEVVCVSHAHIDMNWMWGFQETVSVTVDTFRTILNLMKEYPTFTFGQSQASVYKIIEKYAPDMIPEIKRYIREGRWELTASQWVETDKNMPNGESLTRHILYTKRYLAELFGINPDSLKLDFEPDTFGHNANVPEILQNGGVDYYYHCRGYDGPSIYRWQSPSGKEILVYREFKWYNETISQASFTDVPIFCSTYGVGKTLKVYGVGDHGGGPTRRDLETIIDAGTYPLYPKIKFGTYAEYFAELEKYRDKFTLVKKELNYVFTGCYTSQSEIKHMNRVSEDRLQEAEFLTASAYALTGAKQDTDRYKSAWQNVLFNHFHDILPGSGIRETRDYALGLAQDTLAYVNTGANLAMRNLADAIDTSAITFDDDKNTIAEGAGVGYTMSAQDGHSFPVTERGRGKTRVIHLFNSTAFDRSEPVEFTLWDYDYDLGRVSVTDAKGTPAAFQFTTSRGSGYWGHTFVKLLVDAKIPAMGYSTYIITLKGYEAPASLKLPADPREDYIADNPIVLENERIKAVFNPATMALVSYTDKESGAQLIDKPSCLFRFIKESTLHGMTSWRVGPYMNIAELNNGDYSVRAYNYRVEALRKTIEFEIKFASSKLNVIVTLYNGKAMLEFDCTLDWREIGGEFIPQLGFYVPASYDIEKYVYDIPFGVVERGPLYHDVPANSYMKLVNASGKSLFIATDSKYGFRGNDNSGAVTLIRSSTDPDPYPEFGKHVFKLAVGSSDCPYDITKAVEAFKHPVSFVSNTKHGGKLGLTGSIGKIDGDVIVTSIKTAEDGGVVVRVANPFSDSAAEVTVIPSAQYTYASLVDITEKHTVQSLSYPIKFSVPAYGFVNLLIK
jgi:alpha-mannosidase